MERTSTPAATRLRVTSGAATLGSDTVSTYEPGSSERHSSTVGTRAKNWSGSLIGARVLTTSDLLKSCSRSSAVRPTVRSVVFKMATRSQSFRSEEHTSELQSLRHL